MVPVFLVRSTVEHHKQESAAIDLVLIHKNRIHFSLANSLNLNAQ